MKFINSHHFICLQVDLVSSKNKSIESDTENNYKVRKIPWLLLCSTNDGDDFDDDDDNDDHDNKINLFGSGSSTDFLFEKFVS